MRWNQQFHLSWGKWLFSISYLFHFSEETRQRCIGCFCGVPGLFARPCSLCGVTMCWRVTYLPLEICRQSLLSCPCDSIYVGENNQNIKDKSFWAQTAIRYQGQMNSLVAFFFPSLYFKHTSANVKCIGIKEQWSSKDWKLQYIFPLGIFQGHSPVFCLFCERYTANK